MPVRKMRVEVYDQAGDKYTITFRGRVTRDKAIRLLDLVELLGGMPRIGNEPKWAWHKDKLTKFERVRLVVEKHFPVVWFSSREAQSTYEEEFKEPIRLSTISTYLSRMAERGILMKDRASNRLRYRVATEMMRRVRL